LRFIGILDEQGATPVQNVLRSQGGWPVVEGESWDTLIKPSWSWTEATLQLKEVGISAGYLIGLGVGPDIKNPGRRIITVCDITFITVTQSYDIQ
jgi:hypothetical protein